MMLSVSFVLWLLVIGSMCVYTKTDQSEDQLRKIFNALKHYRRSHAISLLTSSANSEVYFERVEEIQDPSINVTYTKLNDVNDDFFVARLFQVRCEFGKNFSMRFSSPMLRGEGNLRYAASSYPFRIHFPLITDIDTEYTEEGMKQTSIIFKKRPLPHEMSFQIIGQAPTIDIEILKRAAINKIHVLMYKRLVALYKKSKIDISAVAEFCFEKRLEEELSLKFTNNNSELNVNGLSLSHSIFLVMTYKSLKSDEAAIFRIKFTDIKIQGNNTIPQNITAMEMVGTLNSSLCDLRIEIGPTIFEKKMEIIIGDGIKFFIKDFMSKSSNSSSDHGSRFYFTWFLMEAIALLMFAFGVVMAGPIVRYLERQEERRVRRSCTNRLVLVNTSV